MIGRYLVLGDGMRLVSSPSCWPTDAFGLMERRKMQTLKSFFATLMVFAFIVLTPKVRAADQDFTGRWDIQVHAQPGDFAQFTTTAAWWLGITDAGTPDMKIQFVGSPDGSLDNISIAKFHNGVLHFTWKATVRNGHTPNPNDYAEYDVKYVKRRLQGTVTSPATTPAIHLTFTGYRSPEIDEHDDGSWSKERPIQLFDGKDLTG